MRKTLLTLALVLMSYLPEDAMSQDSPTQVALAFLKAMESMDFETGLDHVAEDVEYVNSPGTTVHGHGGVREVLEPFFAPIEENEFIIERTAAEGNVVFVQRLDRHRVAQGWFELPVTAVMEIEDGKISYWREYFDVQTIQTAMAELMGGTP